MRHHPHRLARLAPLALVLAVPFVDGCCRKDDKGSSTSPSSTSTTATTTAAANPNLPVKGPWDAVKITWQNKKSFDGTSQLFTAENEGSKTINVIFMDLYAYDAKGNQIAKKDLSYNRTLAGGAKDDNVSISDVPGAVSWDATYHGIEFDGDTKPTMDDKRAPAKKPKGK